LQNLTTKEKEVEKEKINSEETPKDGNVFKFPF